MSAQPWYTLIMFAAIVAGFLARRRTRGELSLTKGQQWGVAIGAIAGGILGAKLPFVLIDWEGLVSGSAWFENGKTITFGLVGGYLGVEAAKWALDVKTKTGDSFAVPVALSIGIGRWGCFVAGCCYGQPTSLPWGMNFGDGIARHPTQIYESLFHLICAAVLLALQHRGLFQGQLVKLYFIAYFVYRFLTEFIRPEPRWFLNLTGYQWATLALIPLFALLWYHDARAARMISTRMTNPGTT